jgi:hypothetical protein
MATWAADIASVKPVRHAFRAGLLYLVHIGGFVVEPVFHRPGRTRVTAHAAAGLYRAERERCGGERHQHHLAREYHQRDHATPSQ